MKNPVPLVVAALLIVPILVDAQAQSPNQDSILLDAAAAGQTDLVRSLLVSGANIEAKNNVGATSLIFASIKGHLQVVKLLLGRGANVNATTTTGITPLIAAAAGGQVDIVKLLLEKGADVSAKDQQGRSALDMAETTGDTRVQALLKSVSRTSGPTSVSVPQHAGQTHSEIIRQADSEGGLAVRAKPSPQGQVIAYLPVGSKVTYEGEANNGWVRLSAPAVGWVAESYLGSRYPGASVISIDNPEQCLRVRSGPGTNHEKIGCLPKGAKLKLTGTVQSGWAQTVEPIAGWVTARQIQAPGLFPAKQATSGAQKVRGSQSQGAGSRHQRTDSDTDFEQVEQQFDEEMNQFRQENEEAQAVTPSAPPAFGGGIIRIGPFGIGFGR